MAKRIAGKDLSPTHPGVPGPTDLHLWKLIPGTLEFGTMDHVIHIALGVIFLIAGLMTAARLADARS